VTSADTISLAELVEDLEERVEAIEAALKVDAPFLVETAHVMRQVDVSLDVRAARMADIGSRYRRMLDAMRATLEQIEDMRGTNVLDRTVRLGVVDAADEDS
jgi:hypothetical protein